MTDQKDTDTEDGLEFQVASMRRALLSLGSALVAGGPPGAAGYIAWHRDEMKRNPIPRPSVSAPVWSKLRTDGPTLQEYVDAGYPADTYPPAGYEAKPDPASPPDGPAMNEATPVPPVTPAVAPVPTDKELAAATPLPSNVAPPPTGTPMPASLPAAPVGQPAPPSPPPLPSTTVVPKAP